MWFLRAFYEMLLIIRNISTESVVRCFIGLFYIYLQYFIHHCFICRPSDSIVSEDAGIEPRTVAALILAV
jgi:hypothetical protein